MASGGFFRVLRQLSLLVLLIAVAGGSYLARDRTTSWKETLWVTVYPITVGHDDRTASYVGGLDERVFAPIERFMATEAARFGVRLERPVRIDIGRPVAERPPPRPETAHPAAIAFWSLKMRWWAYRVTRKQPGPPPDIRMFLIYHDRSAGVPLPHSLGLQKGMLGVAHLFAARRQAGSNNVVITHEILHTLGATDKYAPDTGLPLYPQGFADPDRAPLYPQKRAEIMGGRIPLSATRARIPAGLESTRIGPQSAAELRWAATAGQ